MRPLFLALALLTAAPVLAADGLPFTFHGVTLVRCMDGDTCRFDLHEDHPVLGRVTFHSRVVRLADVDTPDTWRPHCDAERAAGEKAAARTTALLQAAARIDVEVVTIGKYGRLIAHVLADGRDVSALLISEGLGRPYHGGKRPDWC